MGNQNGKKEMGTEGGVKGKDAIKKMVKKNNKNHHNRVLASINDSLLAPLKPVDDVTPRRLMQGRNKNKISKDLGLLAPYKKAVSAKKLDNNVTRELSLLIRKTRKSLKSARKLQDEKKKDEKKGDEKKGDEKKEDEKKDGDKKDDKKNKDEKDKKDDDKKKKEDKEDKAEKKSVKDDKNSSNAKISIISICLLL